MKLQWSIQSSHTRLVLSQVVCPNYRNEYIWPPTRKWLHIFKTFHLASLQFITSHFEIDDWSFLYFNLMNKFLAFWHHTFQYKSLSLFPSQILVCAMTFAAHYLFLRFDICWAIKQKHKRVGRYIDTSLCMYQNHQDHWLIIHDKLEDWFTTVTHRVKIFPTKIDMHT